MSEMKPRSRFGSLRHYGQFGILAVMLVLGWMAARMLPLAAAEEVRALPAATETLAESGTQTVVFAGGCFWGVQGVFQHLDGVISAVSGYAGGPEPDADYRKVSTGSTGHAESVKVTYDPSRVSFGELLRVFFSVAHDPTQLNRQGPDSGTQYRSAIFAANAEQARVAKAYIAQLDAAEIFSKPIVTRIEDGTFYPAEAYHQDYLTLHPNEAYIRFNDAPKLEALHRFFPDEYRAKPVLVGAT